MNLPLMSTIQQNFPSRLSIDTKEEINYQMEQINLNGKIKPGQYIGITAGSRGIANIAEVTREICNLIKYNNGHPLLIPSMGSHGGGTLQGQLNILEHLGLTKENTGAEIVQENEPQLLGYIGNEIPVFINKAVSKCDSIIILNRVKPHTSFHGPIESGIHKMLAIGLGGPEGAKTIHSLGPAELPRIIPRIAKRIMKHIPVIAGVALVENANKQTHIIKAFTPEKFWTEETELLKTAYRTLPTLPVNNIDLLIVDKIGKNFSGTGMDTNIIGRLRIPGMFEPESPKIKIIAALDLSKESAGNATGIGLADITTNKLFKKIDFSTTYKNVITSTILQRAMLPIIMENDQIAIQTALKTLHYKNFENARVVRIKNTMDLTRIQVSSPLIKEINNKRGIKILTYPSQMEFDTEGYIKPF